MGDSLWRDRDFVRYWAGQTVSRVTQLALPLFSAVRRVQRPRSRSRLGCYAQDRVELDTRCGLSKTNVHWY